MNTDIIGHIVHKTMTGIGRIYFNIYSLIYTINSPIICICFISNIVLIIIGQLEFFSNWI